VVRAFDVLVSLYMLPLEENEDKVIAFLLDNTINKSVPLTVVKR